MTSFAYQGIAENYRRVSERVTVAAESAGRDPGAVKIVVVTKGHPLDGLKQAVSAGLRVFGENYAEEGQAKMQALGEAGNLEWHMIGHIQSRKARQVATHYDWVHSLDSLKLARRLDRFSAEIGRHLPVLLEMNTSGEDTKYGWSAHRESDWATLIDQIEPLMALSNLKVSGLMTMAPFLPDPEDSRPYFQRLARLRDFLARRFPQSGWEELSMGMSADFEVAVQEGATIVRVGTAIMGARI